MKVSRFFYSDFNFTSNSQKIGKCRQIEGSKQNKLFCEKNRQKFNFGHIKKIVKLKEISKILHFLILSIVKIKQKFAIFFLIFFCQITFLKMYKKRQIKEMYDFLIKSCENVKKIRDFFFRF